MNARGEGFGYQGIIFAFSLHNTNIIKRKKAVSVFQEYDFIKLKNDNELRRLFSYDINFFIIKCKTSIGNIKFSSNLNDTSVTFTDFLYQLN